MLHVPSSDGVVVAVHDLAGSDGPDRPVLLVAHATGFHGHAYLPVAAALAPQFHTVAFDFRGHGETPLAPGWEVEWAGYGDDALAAAEAVAVRDADGRPVIGFGHSMGGTGLLLAAHRRPSLFGLLVLFEPIVPPIGADDDPPDSHPVSDLVTATRRRRTLFPSIDAALANYASKPPMSSFDPDALDAYVRYGFYPDVDGAGVRLKCDPELEAGTFLAGTTQRTWELLGEIAVPVVVASGRVEDGGPSRFSQAVADELPHGTFVELPELDHFGPMTHPRLIAELVTAQVLLHNS
jgi:pimeloyl-ACP methyl ester carboxylesterase